MTPEEEFLTEQQELVYLDRVIARMELTPEPWVVYGSIYNHLVKKREELWKKVNDLKSVKTAVS